MERGLGLAAVAPSINSHNSQTGAPYCPHQRTVCRGMTVNSADLPRVLKLPGVLPDGDIALSLFGINPRNGGSMRIGVATVNGSPFSFALLSDDGVIQPIGTDGVFDLRNNLRSILAIQGADGPEAVLEIKARIFADLYSSTRPSAELVLRNTAGAPTQRHVV